VLLDAQPSSGNRVIGSGSDTIVSIAECFYYKTELGDTVTTMPVSDYARAIGNKVCDIAAQILTMNEILVNHENRITVLESTPAPVVVLPQVIPTCVGPSIATPMQTVLSAVEQQFCELRNATGQASQIYTSINAECVNLSNQPTLGVSAGIMATQPGWVVSPANMADTLTNIWITICDLRSAVQYIKDNCCPSGCDGISITLTATFDGTFIKLFFVGTVPAGFADCNGVGNLFTITDDSGNAISQTVNITTYMNSPTGYSINVSGSSLNLASNFTIKTDACFVNTSTNTTCQFCIEYLLDNTASCPTLTLTTTTDTAVNYSFSPFVIPATYTVQLWDGLGLTVIAQNIVSVLSSGTQTGVFNGLTASTNYRLRIVVSTGATTTDCPFVPFTTTPVVCDEPTAVAGVIELPTLCPTCGPVVGFASSPTTDGYYIDDTSPYLLLYSGGSFGNLIQVISDEAVNGSIRQPISFGGRTWVVTSDTEIKVYSGAETGTPVLDTTITPGVSGIVNMVYDTNLDLVFFAYNDTITGFRRIGTINTSIYTVTLNVGPAFSGGGFFIQELYFNPVNFQKYVRVSDGDVYVLSTGATGLTVLATLTAVGSAALRYVVFDPTNGNAWIATSDSTNTEEILVVNGSTYATITTLNTAVAGMQPYVGNVNTNAMTFYSDGTTTAVYVIYRSTAANYNYMIIRYNASTYTETTFLNEGAADVTPQPRQIFYSTLFNKIVYTKATIVEMYDPSSSAVDYTPTIVLGNSALRIHDDTVNSLIVFSTNVASPSNNLFWYELDPSNAIECTEGIVNFYQTVLGNSEGPYVWDGSTLTWPSACTMTVTNLGATFSVVAIFPGITFQAGILAYSVDNGLTWNNFGDFKTEAQWNAGVIYNKADILPYTNFMLRIAFLTDDNCGLASKIDTTFN
jgi:hypothetical protein